MPHRLAILIALVSLSAAWPSAARDHVYPQEKPAIRLAIPDAWKVTTVKGALEARSPDKVFFLSIWEPKDIEKVDEEVGKALLALIDDLEDDTEELEQDNENGLTFSMLHGVGRDKQTGNQVQISAGAFSPGEERVLLIVYTIETDNVTDRNGPAFEAIIESIRATAKTPPGETSKTEASAGDGWKTYTAQKFGLMVDIPQGWTTEWDKDNDGDPLLTAAAPDETLVLNIGTLGKVGGKAADDLLEAYMDGLDMRMYEGPDAVTIKGMKAAQGAAKGKLDGDAIRIMVLVVSREGNGYVIQTLCAEKEFKKNGDIMRRMLKSVRKAN